MGSHDQAVDVPAGKISEILEQDLLDAFQRFFVTLELGVDEVLERFRL